MSMSVDGLKILVVEDEPDILESIQDALGEHGHHVTSASDGEQAMRRLDGHRFDLAICDVRLPKVDGLEIFRRIRREQPESEVILMSAYGSVAEAVDVMKEKAAHYLAKPFSLDLLLNLVERVAEQRVLHTSLNEKPDDGEAHRALLVGSSPAVETLRRRISAIAVSDAAVLITGESGTGKELVARLLHEQSPRADKPFVAVNCAAFPDTLLEAELFGHEKGAFTGAQAKRMGRFQAAHTGTLFLDEVGDMSLTAQAKLLRALEDGSYQPLGSDRTIQVDVRVVSATNADLQQRIEQGAFREDMFHRLKVFHLHVPPLRERLADFPILVRHFYSQCSGDASGTLRISPRAWAALKHHRFPGNVRELRHVLEHAVVLAKGKEIDVEHLPVEIIGNADAPVSQGPLQPLGPAIKEFEREYLVRALQQCAWQRTRTAEMLGISRKTLWQKLRQHGIVENEGH